MNAVTLEASGMVGVAVLLDADCELLPIRLILVNL